MKVFHRVLRFLLQFFCTFDNKHLYLFKSNTHYRPNCCWNQCKINENFLFLLRPRREIFPETYCEFWSHFKSSNLYVQVKKIKNSIEHYLDNCEPSVFMKTLSSVATGPTDKVLKTTLHCDWYTLFLLPLVLKCSFERAPMNTPFSNVATALTDGVHLSAEDNFVQCQKSLMFFETQCSKSIDF